MPVKNAADLIQASQLYLKFYS